MRKYLNIRANIALGLIIAFLLNTLGLTCSIANATEVDFFAATAWGDGPFKP